VAINTGGEKLNENENRYQNQTRMRIIIKTKQE
jgi:hypothetical protein